MRRLLGLLLAAVLASLGQALLGWWALAAVGFGFGFFARLQPWPASRFGGAILVAGVARLAWLDLSGAPVRDVSRMVAGITTLPVMLLAVVIPALVGLCAAFLGVALGRRVLFG